MFRALSYIEHLHILSIISIISVSIVLNIIKKTSIIKKKTTKHDN